MTTRRDGGYVPIEHPGVGPNLTIHGGVTIGRFTDEGTAATVSLRTGCGYIVAMRAGGATMLLQNMTTTLVQMRDTLVWHISAGFSLSAPWLTKTRDFPPIDWVAGTEGEAATMLESAVKIAHARRKFYAENMIANDQTTLPVRPDRPQIVILIDKDDFDDDDRARRRIQDALAELRRVGPAMGVVTFSAYLRGTGDYLSNSERETATTILAGRTRDEADLANVAEWSVRAFPRLAGPGHLALYDRGQARRLDAFRVTSLQIDDVADTAQDYLAGTRLDDRSADAVDEVYAERWNRTEVAEFLEYLRYGRVRERLNLSMDGALRINSAFDGLRQAAGPLVGAPDQVRTVDDLVTWCHVLRDVFNASVDD